MNLLKAYKIANKMRGVYYEMWLNNSHDEPNKDSEFIQEVAKLKDEYEKWKRLTEKIVSLIESKIDEKNDTAKEKTD